MLWEGAQHPAASILFPAEQSEYPSQEAEAWGSRGVSACVGTRGAAALTLCSGSQFKQVQLGDKMDLASYLLKPIQRMSKYALLLKDLIKECSEAQEQELGYLRAAEEMVKFQLRHGNDLLAMDAIRDCDVSSSVLPSLPGGPSRVPPPSLGLGSLGCVVSIPSNPRSGRGARLPARRSGTAEAQGKASAGLAASLHC